MSQIFWGSPHKHVPVIKGKQFHFHGAYTDKETADRIAKAIRGDGSLARVQKKTITSTFGKRRRVVGNSFVVFKAKKDPLLNRRKW